MPEICGNAIAAWHIAAWRFGSRSGLLETAVIRDHHEFHVVFADDPDWQKRSGDAVLRIVFMNAGISNLSTDAANNSCRSWQRRTLCKAVVSYI